MKLLTETLLMLHFCFNLHAARGDVSKSSLLPMKMNRPTTIGGGGIPLFSKPLWTTAIGKDHSLCHMDSFFRVRTDVLFMSSYTLNGCLFQLHRCVFGLV